MIVNFILIVVSDVDDKEEVVVVVPIVSEESCFRIRTPPVHRLPKMRT